MPAVGRLPPQVVGLCRQAGERVWMADELDHRPVSSRHGVLGYLQISLLGDVKDAGYASTVLRAAVGCSAADSFLMVL
jgi:hypothetical protein